MIDHCLLQLSKFKKGKYIGCGSFARVYEVIDVDNGQKYAAKISNKNIDLENINDKKDVIDLAREVNINSKLDHPCITKFIGYSPKNFDNKSRPVIVVELATNGSLRQIMESERKGLSIEGWDDTKKLIVIYGICSGMAYLHKNKIYHRDLKSDNILLDSNLFPMIADFGLSKIYNDSIISTLSVKGSLIFAAPEIHLGQKYSEKSDVYSFSYIIYEIITGELPFSIQTQTIYQIIDDVVKNKYRPKFKPYVPESYRKLIEDCWSHDPSNRPTFDEISNRLRSCPGFITQNIRKDDFINYVNQIDNTKSSFFPTNQLISLPKNKETNQSDLKNDFYTSVYQRSTNNIESSNQQEQTNILSTSVYQPPKNILSSSVYPTQNSGLSNSVYPPPSILANKSVYSPPNQSINKISYPSNI